MEDELVSYETAKSAKWYADFEVPCLYGFNEPTKEEIGGKGEPTNWNSFRKFISRPTQSLLQRWLREKHNVHIQIASYHCLREDKPFGLFIDNRYNDSWSYVEYTGDSAFETYEKALEHGLIEALKVIKEKKY